jgi:hypothetical protein
MSDSAITFAQDGPSIQVEVVGTVRYDYDYGWDVEAGEEESLIIDVLPKLKNRRVEIHIRTIDEYD